MLGECPHPAGPANVTITPTHWAPSPEGLNLLPILGLLQVTSLAAIGNGHLCRLYA